VNVRDSGEEKITKKGKTEEISNRPMGIAFG